MNTHNTTAILHSKSYDLGKAAERFSFLLLDEPATHQHQPHKNTETKKQTSKEVGSSSHYHRPIFKMPKHDVLL